MEWTSSGRGRIIRGEQWSDDEEYLRRMQQEVEEQDRWMYEATRDEDGC